MQKKVRENLISFSFILPFSLFFAVFVLVPLGYVLYLSFHKGTLLNSRLVFSGLRNYLSVTESKDFRNSFLNSLIYILCIVPVGQVISLFFARLLRRKTRLNGVFETIYFLPMLVSMVAASVVIAYILSQKGPVNYLLQQVGLPAINWLGNEVTARISLMILEMWKGGSFFIFVYMAAIRALPEDCCEAARIDGANRWQEFFHVMLPMLHNTVVLSVIMSTIWQFQIFESVYMLTGGGPLKKTETVVYSIYQYSFQYSKIGMGSAASVMFLMMIALVSLLEMLMMREKKEGGIRA